MIRLFSCKELDTMNVRYIETGGWEITKPDGTKVCFRKARQAYWNIRRFFNTTARGAREWMAKAKTTPVSFDEFIPHYAEIVRCRNGMWQMLAKNGEWEDIGTRSRARGALRWCTDLNPKETKRVLDYAERYVVED